MSNFFGCIQKGKKLALTVQDGQYGLFPTAFKRMRCWLLETEKYLWFQKQYLHQYQSVARKAAIGRLKGNELETI